MRSCYLKPGWKKCCGKLQGQISTSSLIEVEEPGFLNPQQGDYHLQPGSPLRDVGTVATAKTLPVEYEPAGLTSPAKLRAKVNGLDIGCFEAR